MNNWEIATEATNTAINSQGSAMREQAKYAESLEGRLNRLDTAWNAFTLSVGDAILTDSFIGMVEGAGNLANAVADLVDKIGFLPTLLGTVGVATLLFSKNARGAVTSLIAWATATTTATKATSVYGDGLTRMSRHATVSAGAVDATGGAITRSARHATAGAVAIRTFSTALKGVAVATGVGIALVGVGIVIEQVIKIFSDAAEESKKMQESIDTSVAALTTNKDEVEDLISKMQALGGSDVDFSFGDLDVEKQAEYMQIQQRLAELYPNLVKSIDSAGIAHFKNAEDINKEKAATEELIKLKEKQIILDAKKSISDAQNEAEKAQKKADSLRAEANSPTKVVTSEFGGFTEIKKTEEEILKAQIAAKEYEQQMVGSLKKVNNEIIEIANAYPGLEIPSYISKNVEEFIGKMDFSKIKDDELVKLSEKIAKIKEELAVAFEAGDTKGIEKASLELADIGLKYGKVKLDVDDFSGSLETSKSKLEGQTGALDENGNAVEEVGDAYEELLKQSENAIAGLVDVNENQIKYADNLLYIYDLLGQKLSLYTQEEINSVLAKVELTNSTDDLTESEKLLYNTYLQSEDAYNSLIAMYPQLVESQDLVNMSKAETIEWINQEILAQDQYLKAQEMSRNGQLTAEEEKTLNSLEQTNARIDIINAEIDALRQRSIAYQEFARAAEAAINAEDPDVAARAGLAAMRTSMNPAFSNLMNDIQAKNAEKASIRNGDLKKFRSEIAKIDGINANASTRAGKALDKQAKANEKAAKATEKATKAAEKNGQVIETQIKAYDLFSYAADRYANAQNRINASMAKYDLILKKFPKHTKEYRQALREQADLLTKQRKLVNTQYKDIEGQIASGVFKPVGVFADGQVLGVITTSSSSGSNNISGGGGSGGNSSGGGNKATGNSNSAKAWNFFKSQGFNDNAVAGILGNLQQESRIDPKAKQNGGRGKGRGIAQWEVGGRWDQLVKWAKKNNRNEWDIQTQLEYLLLEINGAKGVDGTGYKLLNKKFGGMAGFKNASNTDTAMRIFEKSYERAGKPNYNNRLKYANDFKSQYGGSGGGASVASKGNDTFSGSLGKATGVIGYAQKFVGKVPYVFGGNSLASGIDCSAFVQQIVKKTTGYSLPRTAATQSKHGTSVNKANIQAGDLVFFKGTYGGANHISHVVISTGGTKAIGAQSSGGVGVIDFGSGYWAKHYAFAKRLSYTSSKDPSTGISYSGNPGSASASGGGSSGGSSGGSTVISDTTGRAQAISDMSKDKANTAQLTDEAKQKLLQLKTDLYGIDAELEDIRHEIIMSYTYELDKKIEDREITAQKYQNLTYWMDKNSQEYRENVLEQRKALIQKQNLITQEEASIRHLMKTTQMSAATRFELERKLAELHNERITNATARDALNWEILESSMREFQEQIDKTTRSMSRLQALRQRMRPDSKEYRDSLRQEAAGLAAVNKELMEQMNKSERQKYYYKLTPEQEKERQKSMDDAQDQIIANNNAIEDLQNQLIGKIIEAAKKGYEQRRDIEIKRVEQSVKLAEEESKKKIDAIQKEALEYEKAIRRKIEAINSQYAEDNYLKNLKKLQEEERKIQKKIAILALDDSQEAKAKKIELEQQLKDIREQIEDEQTQHSIDKQIEALEKELEKNQEAVDDKVKTEEDKMDEVRKKSEEEIKNINWKYNEILNDEKKWNNLRQELLKGNTREMMDILNEHLIGLKNFGQDTMKELEISYTGLLTMLQDIRDAGKDLGVVGDLNDYKNDSPHKDENFQEKNEAWNKYLSNKRKYDRPETTAKEKQQLAKDNEALRKKWGFIDGNWRDLEKLDINSIDNDPQRQERLLAWQEYIKNKEEYSGSPTGKRAEELRTRNSFLRNKYNFPDAPVNVLKSLDSDLISQGTDDKTAEKVRDWIAYLTNKRLYVNVKTLEDKKRLQEENSKLRKKWMFPDGSIEYLSSLDPLKFHDGGLVGGKSSKLGNLLNQFFNTNPDEQVIKSLKGELQIPPKNFGNVVGNIQQLASSIARDNTPIMVDGATHVHVNIDSFVGTQENANALKNTLKNLKLRGRT